MQAPHFDIPFRFSNPSGIVLYKDMILDANPQAYWRFLSANPGLDSSNRNHPLTFTGGVSGSGSLINDPADQGLHFDGTSGKGTATPWLSNAMSYATVEAWIQPDALPGNFAVVWYNNGQQIYIDSTGALTSSFITSNGNFGPGIGGIIAANKKYHVVWVFDNGLCTIYLNGVPSATVGKSPGTVNMASNFIVGAQNNLYWWKGYIDEVAVYDYAMTQVEIEHHYVTGNVGHYLQQGAAVVEQNTFEEIANCVEAIVRTPVGFRQDNLSFGFPHVELMPQPVLAQLFTDVITSQEPRADIVMAERPDQYDALIDRITIQISQPPDVSTAQTTDNSEGLVTL
jgi:hypothetical protein